MDFLEVLERTRAGDAYFRTLFEDTRGERGVRSIRRSPDYKRKLAEAAAFVAGIYTGRIPAYRFREVMTTSDFPQLFGDILDRSVLAAYTEWPDTWTNVAKRVTVNDFRDAKIFPSVWGADGPLSEVSQASEYPEASVYEQTPITLSVRKYGRVVPFSWESMINDDLDQLKDVPVRLGRGARRTEADLVTRLYVDANGPHASLYTAGNKNKIVTAVNASISDDNPPLSIQGLQDAFTILNSMLDENGQPIMREAVTLVVPPALEVTARNILNATELRATQLRAGGSPDNTSGLGYQELSVANWMRNNVTLVVNPYIPLVATTNGNTSWFLFGNPNTSREAIRIGFLRGHETPEIWLKSPNAIRVGGGEADPMDGDFDTDSVTYKVRHVVGAVRIDPKATVASNGTGSP